MILCKGPCGKLLPATNEHYFFRTSSRNGKSYPSTYCKVCEKSKSAKSRRDRYATVDGKEAIDGQHAKYIGKNPLVPEQHRLEMNDRYANDPVFRQARIDYSFAWRQANPEKKKAASRIRHQRTKKRTRLKMAIFATFYPDMKLRGNLKVAICEAMKQAGGSKGGRSILKHLPYTMDQLRQHLESLWEPWMNWSNYGPWSAHRDTWQIDHIIPQALLPYDDFSHPNFLKCWILSNLRPLESMKNIQKGNRLI